MLTFLSDHILPKLTVFTELITVFPSLDTSNTSMGPTVFLVIRVPRFKPTWQLKAQNRCKG